MADTFQTRLAKWFTVLIQSLDESNNETTASTHSLNETRVPPRLTPTLQFREEKIQNAFDLWLMDHYKKDTLLFIFLFGLTPIVYGLSILPRLLSNPILNRVWYSYLAVMPGIAGIVFAIVRFQLIGKWTHHPYVHPWLAPYLAWLLIVMSSSWPDLLLAWNESQYPTGIYGGPFPSGFYIIAIHSILLSNHLYFPYRMLLASTCIALIIPRWWLTFDNPVENGAFIGIAIYVAAFMSAVMAGIHRELILKRNFYIAYHRQRKRHSEEDPLIMASHISAGLKDQTNEMTDEGSNKTERNGWQRLILYFHNNVLIMTQDNQFETRFHAMTCRRVYGLLRHTLPVFVLSHGFTLLGVYTQHQLYYNYETCANIRLVGVLALLIVFLILIFTVSFDTWPQNIQRQVPLVTCTVIACCALYAMLSYAFCTNPRSTYFFNEVLSEYVIILLTMGGTLGIPNRFLLPVFTVLLLVSGMGVLFLKMQSSWFTVSLVVMLWMITSNSQMERERRMNLKHG